MSNVLYESLVQVTEEYLGPSAPRFVDRQIRSHLHKEPTQINRQDFSRLYKWLHISFCLLTDDKKVINDFEKNIKSLMTGRI